MSPSLGTPRAMGLLDPGRSVRRSIPLGPHGPNGLKERGYYIMFCIILQLAAASKY